MKSAAHSIACTAARRACTLAKTMSVLQPAAGAYCADARHKRNQRSHGFVLVAYQSLACRSLPAHRLLYSVSHAEQHDKPGHPEAAARITKIEQALAKQNFQPQLDLVLGRSMHAQAVMRSLELVHPAGYLRRVQEICSCLQEPSMVDESTYICPGSFTACCETAAAVLAVLDAVLADSGTPAAAGSSARSRAGFCLVRPPGHHVLPSRPMGFGLFNFIAVAARHAQHQQAVPVRKVLIVDFDVHHGNGTEEIMYSDSSVLYISTHQQGLWPYTGKVHQVGSGGGKGYTINIPLPGGAGHAAMQQVLEQVIRPAAHRFQPDLILVSAGYDSHFMDPLAGLQLESRTYHMLCGALAQMSQDLCSGRCMFVLEGGYHQQSLAEAVVDSFAGVLGMPLLSRGSNTALPAEPLAKVEELLAKARELHDL